MKLSLNDYDGDGAGEGNALWKRKMFNNVIRLLNKSSKTLLPRAYTFWCIFVVTARLLRERSLCKVLARVVQTLDSAIHRINHYPADKYYGNQLRYPLDSDLSGG